MELNVEWMSFDFNSILHGRNWSISFSIFHLFALTSKLTEDSFKWKQFNCKKKFRFKMQTLLDRPPLKPIQMSYFCLETM